MTNEAQIVGFVGEYADGSDLLICARPVIKAADRYHAALTDDWALEGGTRPLAAGDLEYVNLGLGGPEASTVAHGGELVWLAGAGFINTLQLDSSLWPHRGYFARWSKYRAGFSYQIGRRQQFDQLQRGIYHDLKIVFLNSLFGQLEVQLGLSETLFWALSSLPPEDEAEQMLLEGLFYHERRDDAQVSLARECAVDEGLFDSPSSFDSALKNYRKKMTNPRLRELPNAPSLRQLQPQLAVDDTLDFLNRLMNWPDLELAGTALPLLERMRGPSHEPI